MVNLLPTLLDALAVGAGTAPAELAGANRGTPRPSSAVGVRGGSPATEPDNALDMSDTLSYVLARGPEGGKETRWGRGREGAEGGRAHDPCIINQVIERWAVVMTERRKRGQTRARVRVE